MATRSILTTTYAVTYNAHAADGGVTNVVLSDLNASGLADVFRFVARANDDGQWYIPAVGVSDDLWHTIGWHYAHALRFDAERIDEAWVRAGGLSL